MTLRAAAVTAAVGLSGATAHGAIFFTFQDPGPDREVTITENEDNSLSLSYSFAETVSLFITSDEGEIPNTTFEDTRLTLNLTTSTSPLVDNPGLYVSHISGEFVFEDVSGMMPATILTGVFDDAVATLLSSELLGVIEASGSAVGDSVVGSLQLIAGAALTPLLAPGTELGGRQTASFALAELTGGETEEGLAVLEGSAAFTGSSETIPAPGAAGLFGLGLLAMSRRRR